MVVAARDPTLAELEADPLGWMLWFQRPYVSDRAGTAIPFAPHHRQYWRWLASIPRDHAEIAMRDPAFIGIWARGGAKSTSAEAGAAYLGALQRRKFAWYVSGSQAQANQHVENVGGMLTGDRFAAAYPAFADRMVYERSGRRGAWRQNRLQTAGGFVVDAVGLDRAVRGVRVAEDRPDLIILDDVDDENDSAMVTAKKVARITRAILPAGASGNTVVIAIQNLIMRGGVFDQLRGGSLGILSRRILSGPIPAVHKPVIEYDEHGRPRLVGGTPSWPGGQSLEVCQAQIDSWGLEAWQLEAQHEVRRYGQIIYPAFDETVHAWAHADVPPFVAVYGGLDFGGEGENANESAGLVAGLTRSGLLILLGAFKDNGAAVVERQQRWMAEQEARWQGPGSIQWAADPTELLGVPMLRNAGWNIVSAMKGGQQPMREARVRMVGRRWGNVRMTQGGLLTPPSPVGMFYLRDMENAAKFIDEVTHYRRRQPPPGNETTQPTIVKRDDHLMSALEYMVELVDAAPEAPDDEKPMRVEWVAA
ncbi:MAG: hypothetical protein NUW01_03705 [Gemmatimonadaceae bacterium]|nr:hypothetical protein [Gemmatimonadaceae bacterium]